MFGDAGAFDRRHHRLRFAAVRRAASRTSPSCRRARGDRDLGVGVVRAGDVDEIDVLALDDARQSCPADS
jgi:hypothetical protein